MPAYAVFAFGLLALAWSALRTQASRGTGSGRGPICWAALPLDVLPLALGWLLLLSLTRRPALSAIGIAAMAAGIILGDHAKRATLREPLVFADRAEVLEVVRHPRLYIPFAGPFLVAGIIVSTAVLIGGFFWFEPPGWSPSPLLTLPLCAAALFIPGSKRVAPQLARLYRALQPTNDPAVDMRRFGFCACLIMHATLALDERPDRQALIGSFNTYSPAPNGPVVLLQVESFFDARRLGDLVPREMMPGLDRLTALATQSGRLAVPCWGANTVRTEFSALTGVGSAALGLDRFNPYERFARVRLRSLAWEMKSLGYRTICVHPFDPSFYGRDRVMPLLGFDEFRGPEAFGGAARAGAYVTDEAVAAEIVRLMLESGPRVFIFGVTMGNHGPWDEPQRHQPLPCAPNLDGLPERAALLGFLEGLRGSDRMIAALMDGMPECGMLAVYGDHQPSLPKAFEALNFDDERTDYAIWCPGRHAGPTRDAAAEDLPGLMLGFMQGSTTLSTMDSAELDLS